MQKKTATCASTVPFVDCVSKLNFRRPNRKWGCFVFFPKLNEEKNQKYQSMSANECKRTSSKF